MKKLFLGIAATALMATGAIAADPVLAPQPAYSTATFDWDGFYMGLGISGIIVPSTSVTAVQGDVIAGFNATSGSMLFGAEMWLGGIYTSTPASSFELGGQARIGHLITPDTLLYVAGGFQHYLAPADTFVTVGGGVEFAVTNDLTFDLEYKFGSRITGAALTAHSVGASLNWHF